jgi:hypothetical protein
MKDKELRDIVVQYATNTSIVECVELFKGIVSRDTVYRWMKDIRYLDYTYTLTECHRELSNLKKSPPSYDSLPTRNRIIHTHQPHFFDTERELWKDKDIRKKLIDNRTKYLQKTNFSDREILRGFKISGIHMGYTHFSPLWVTKFVEDYKPVCIYDPCGGWGHRLLGCYMADVKYIYNDKWDKSYNGCMDIADFLEYYDCKFYNEDCTSFTPPEDYDCIFTCPPYNNIEVYNNSPIEDYDDFLCKMMAQSIKDSVNLIGIVINLPYIDNIIQSIPKTFSLVNKIPLGTTHHSSHFNKENSYKQEVLLVFKKVSLVE